MRHLFWRTRRCSVVAASLLACASGQAVVALTVSLGATTAKAVVNSDETDPVTAEPRFQSALRAARVQHYLEAIASLESLQRDFPRNETVLFYLADLLVKAGQLDPARATLKLLTETSPQYARAWALWADVELQAIGDETPPETAGGRGADAIAYAERAATLKADVWEHHMLLARALSAAARFTEAIAAYRQALTILGDKSDQVSGVYYELGLAYLETGQLVRAKANMTAALRREPENPRYLLDLALVSIKLGEVGTATEHLRHALKASGSAEVTAKIASTLLPQKGNKSVEGDSSKDTATTPSADRLLTGAEVRNLYEEIREVLDNASELGAPAPGVRER